MKRLWERISKSLAGLEHRFGLVVLLLVLFSALEAFARAGGGGGYGGGGGGFGGGGYGGGGYGGGGSGGGDGLGVFVYLLVRLVMDHPFVGVPLVIVIVVLGVLGFREGQRNAVARHQGRVIGRESRLHKAADCERGILAIVQRDPEFDVLRLGERIKPAFVKVQEAWCAQTLDPIRPFVTDGIYERFSLQIEELRARNLVNKMEDLEVLSVVLAEAYSDEMFDTVCYRITATAVDMEVDRDSGKLVSGSKHQEPFSEYWSFVRRPGVKSSLEEGLLEGNCPNCGAGLEVNQAAKCQSCGALVKSGQYDWVLAEITQACEWQPSAGNAIPGVSELRRADPGFSVQHLEDRASVIFWRLMATYREGRIDPVKKVALASFCQGVLPQLRRDAKGVRRYPGNCAVGAVTTKAVVLDEELDKAIVEIRWSNYLTEADAKGKLRETNNVQLRTEGFVLIRKHGVGGKGDFALTSAHCPGCGSPVSDSLSNECEFCGTVLNDISSDWILQARLPIYGEEIQRLMQAATAGAVSALPSAGGFSASGLEQAAWMVKVMVADGIVDPEERKLLEAFAARKGLTSDHLDQLIQSAMADGLEFSIPRDRDEVRRWLEAMVEMALADGKIEPQEQGALLALARHLKLSKYDLTQLIVKTRSRLYRETKERLREERRKSRLH